MGMFSPQWLPHVRRAGRPTPSYAQLPASRKKGDQRSSSLYNHVRNLVVVVKLSASLTSGICMSQHIWRRRPTPRSKSSVVLDCRSLTATWHLFLCIATRWVPASTAHQCWGHCASEAQAQGYQRTRCHLCRFQCQQFCGFRRLDLCRQRCYCTSF